MSPIIAKDIVIIILQPISSRRGGLMQRKPQVTFLKQFWEEFAIYGKRRIDAPSPKGKAKVLDQLITFSSYIFSVPSTDIHKKQRDNFNSLLKTHKWQYCFACGGKAQVRHHIFLIKHGGSNSGKNIVRLCRSCHAEIHPWLKNS